ncbi:MAG TPA: copper chaperone PCu(A)C [Methylophilus sp.]|nr:copper chaperone PCu(A)C [Methylophilus sp.]
MHKTAFFLRLVASLCLLGFLGIAHAEVKLTDAWVRASNPGQSVGAAYVTLSSTEDVTLVYAETERAGTVEMHSMTMQNGIMKMRSMEELPVPAGKPVKLAPGGLHLMLFELATPFKAGEQVKFRLCFKDKQGKITDQFVTMPVKSAP